MAKRRGDKEYVFKPPKFDRVEYIKSELENMRVSFVSLIYGFLTAVLTVILYGYFGESTAFFGLIASLSIKYIYPYIFDTSKFEKKHWAGNFFMVLITWLAIATLLLNPPFNDYIPPEIKDFQVSYYSGNGTVNCNEVQPGIFTVDAGNSLRFNVTVYDNSRVKSVAYSITDIRGGGNTTSGSMIQFGDTSLWYVNSTSIENNPLISGREYYFNVTASDIFGNDNTFTGHIVVNS